MLFYIRTKKEETTEFEKLKKELEFSILCYKDEIEKKESILLAIERLEKDSKFLKGIQINAT